MRSESDIERDLLALGRPSFASARTVTLKDLNQLQAKQAEWDASHPQEAARFAQLLAELRELDQRDSAARRFEAEQARALSATRRLVGERIADVLKTPDTTHAMGAAREWDASARWCLVLLGGVGSGKSVAAGWCAHQSLARGDSAMWLRASEASTASLYGAEAQERALRARGVRLLVLDDLGAEMNSEAWKTWLEDVLGARYANGLRTVITTNLDAEGLKARLGQRLTDRVREGMVVGIAAVSMRKRGAA